ncbi:hypothetical protein LTR95_001876 [Oleoguttula sp. CCFEE 5521]
MVTNAVQCYSTEGQRLTSPPETLASSPVVLAVSSDGGLMITAERDPPVVYLTDLRGTTASKMVVLQSSGTGVAVAAFHPERPEVFLIGFADVFDARRLTDVVNDGVYADQKRVGTAELGRLRNLHKSTSSKSGSRQKSITGVAFLPDHAPRVASVGADGRCRLSDFSGKPTVLRTWHCKVPLTCVATSRSAHSAIQASLRNGASTCQSKDPATSLIAVGSEHGTVELYTSLGSLKQCLQFGRKGERIISAEWVNGPSPGLSARVASREPNSVLVIPSATVRSRRRQTGHYDGSVDPHCIGIHPALRPSTTRNASGVPQSTRKFTIHPDEEDVAGTVRRARSQTGTSIAPPVILTDRDLFSTASTLLPAGQGSCKPRRRMALVSRPRVSTSTFVKRTVSSSSKKPMISWPLNKEHLAGQSHATGSTSSMSKRKGTGQLRRQHGSLAVRERPRRHRDPGRNEQRHKPTPKSTQIKVATPMLEATARNLVRRAQSSGHVREARAEHSEAPQPKLAAIANRKPLIAPPQPVLSPPKPPIESRVHGRGGRWVIDSVSEESWSALHEDELWLTSEDEQPQSTGRQHHLFRRAQAHLTSRSRAGLQDVGVPVQVFSRPSTVPQLSPPSSHAVPTRAKTGRAKPLAPDSEQLRLLFPRSSSLRRGRKKQGKSTRPPQSVQPQLASQVTSSTVAGQSTINERRVHARSTTTVPGDGVELRKLPGRLHEARDCCAHAAARIRALEGELYALKLGLAAMKPALRSHAAAGD